MWFIGVEVEQETSAKVLDPPLQYYMHVANGLRRSDIVLLIFIIIIFQQQ